MSSSPRNIPMWVCVLPTSMVSSIGRSKHAHPLDALSFERVGGGGEGGSVGQRQAGVELQQRGEDEAASEYLAVREGQPAGLVLEIAEQQQVHVDRPWP